jgi:CO dehydrogenase/acetyl-CoA synthase delta subunit
MSTDPGSPHRQYSADGGTVASRSCSGEALPFYFDASTTQEQVTIDVFDMRIRLAKSKTMMLHGQPGRMGKEER